VEGLDNASSVHPELHTPADQADQGDPVVDTTADQRAGSLGKPKKRFDWRGTRGLLARSLLESKPELHSLDPKTIKIAVEQF
jgi:hypothetical protein